MLYVGLNVYHIKGACRKNKEISLHNILKLVKNPNFLSQKPILLLGGV